MKAPASPRPAPPSGAAPSPHKSRCRIIAHRGASHLAPENTLSAARLAWELGSDGVEVDIHLSRDGVPVALHDATTGRTTDGDHSVPALTVRELQQLNAAARHGGSHPFEKIPRLGELFSIVPPGGRMVVEIKANTPELLEALAFEIRQSGLAAGQVVLATFDYAFAVRTKRRLPEHAVLWLVADYHNLPAEAWPERTNVLIARVREGGLDGLDVGACHDYDPAVFLPNLRRIRETGLMLLVWTVNDPEKARPLWELPVDGITTDTPDLLLEAMSGSCGL